MKHKVTSRYVISICTISICALITLAVITPCQAETGTPGKAGNHPTSSDNLALDGDAQKLMQSEMKSLYSPLKTLVPYLAEQGKFLDPANRSVITSSLEQLRTKFHTVEAIPSRYKRMPGFTYAVTQVRDILDDATSRISEGKAGYAWWRARVLPSACFACHATYNVTSVFHPDDLIDTNLPLMDKARFLLATRQFQEAEHTLLSVLNTPEQRINYGEAIRSVLTIELRSYHNPSQAITKLTEILKTTTLAQDDQKEVEQWIKTLSSLPKQKPSDPPSELVLKGEKMISAGLPSHTTAQPNTVLLLIGTELLQKGLASAEMSTDHRRLGLFLLGAAYHRLPLYFAESWSSLYLEQCITEFPGSKEAKQSFKVYKEALIEEFSGSSGTNFPPEVNLKLDELHKLAFGEVSPSV
jgi:hypothetical protein